FDLWHLQVVMADLDLDPALSEMGFRLVTFLKEFIIEKCNQLPMEDEIGLQKSKLIWILQGRLFPLTFGWLISLSRVSCSIHSTKEDYLGERLTKVHTSTSSTS
ncbi:hypothetical protein HAX54_039946, partial [Datura stramonium]|nr:hypothetical protein [Datura stramonium]